MRLFLLLWLHDVGLFISTLLRFVIIIFFGRRINEWFLLVSVLVVAGGIVRRSSSSSLHASLIIKRGIIADASTSNNYQWIPILLLAATAGVVEPFRFLPPSSLWPFPRHGS